jgi:hypothetical protein
MLSPKTHYVRPCYSLGMRVPGLCPTPTSLRGGSPWTRFAIQKPTNPLHCHGVEYSGNGPPSKRFKLGRRRQKQELDVRRAPASRVGEGRDEQVPDWDLDASGLKITILPWRPHKGPHIQTKDGK